jgi:hypothetical protein
MFGNLKKPSHLTIDLTQTLAGWRTSEVHGSGFSLRTLYKSAMGLIHINVRWPAKWK